MADELARDLRARRTAIEDDARSEVARWSAIEGARLDQVADALVRRVVAIALEEGS